MKKTTKPFDQKLKSAVKKKIKGKKYEQTFYVEFILHKKGAEDYLFSQRYHAAANTISVEMFNRNMGEISGHESPINADGHDWVYTIYFLVRKSAMAEAVIMVNDIIDNFKLIPYVRMNLTEPTDGPNGFTKKIKNQKILKLCWIKTKTSNKSWIKTIKY